MPLAFIGILFAAFGAGLIVGAVLMAWIYETTDDPDDPYGDGEYDDLLDQQRKE